MLHGAGIFTYIGVISIRGASGTCSWDIEQTDSILSLYNQEIRPLKTQVKYDSAMLNLGTFGPLFGGIQYWGQGLMAITNCNLHTVCK